MFPSTSFQGSVAEQLFNGPTEHTMAALGTEAVKLEQLIETVCKEAAELLKDHYYNYWDTSRRLETAADGTKRAKLATLFHPDASLTWQGRTLTPNELHGYIESMYVQTLERGVRWGWGVGGGGCGG